MEHLHKYFNIPSYYIDIDFKIHSENLMSLFGENPIEYMRNLFSANSKHFYNVRDELLLRGIGFQPEFQNNYLLDRKFEIQHILYKNVNTNAFESINFAMLGATNFIERFNVKSDLFFNNMPLEGVLHFTQGVPFTLLRDLFKEAGFLIIPIDEYLDSPNHAIGRYNDTDEKVKKQTDQDEKSLEIENTDNISMLDAPIKYYFNDAIFLSFLKYCHLNDIQIFSELTVDNIGKFQYQKHVRRKTVIKVMELYHEIHRKYDEFELNVRDAITLLQNNSFKSIIEIINIDYLVFLNDFYSSDGVGIYQSNFSFESAKDICQQVMDSSDELIAKKRQQEFTQLISEIEIHPKLKYINSFSFAELQEIFNITWDTSLNLQVFLFDVLEDMSYNEMFSDILVKLNQMNEIQKILENAVNTLKPRELEVLRLRRTMTLQEVGEEIGLTRERARQIELKGRTKLVNFTRELNIKLYFKYCTEHSRLLTLENFMKVFEIDGDLSKAILENFFEIDESITFLKELESYILTSDYDRLRESIEKIDYSQPIIEIDELKQIFNEDIFNVASEVIDLLIRSHNYKRVNKIYVKETINIIARINYLFKSVIKEPLLMDDDGYDLFKQYMEETFGIPFDSNKRSATSRIAAGDNVILVEGNTFARHKGETISKSFLNKIENVIDERLTTFEYADPRLIFKEYEPLMQEVGLYSPVHLYSIIQLYLGEKYETGHRNTLYIFKSNGDLLDAETILLNYLYGNGHEVKREKLLEDLNWKDPKLDQLIQRIKTVVIVGNAIVKTIESFNFTEEELVELKNLIECELEKGFVFTYDLQFELAFNEKLESLIERCNLNDDVTLAAIMKWLYPNINGYSKLLYWSNSSITKIEQAISIEFPEFISRNEMLEYVERKGYSDQRIYRLPTDILKDGLFYKYTNTKYINGNLLTFSSEVKQSLENYLRDQFVSKVYCPLFDLVGYSQAITPISTYEWTEHLIGQIAEQFGYRKIETHIDYRYDKPVLVKSDMPINNFEELVLYILKNEYTGRFHEEDLAKYLVSKKIAHNPRRLTNEIYNSPLFKFDSFGFFEIRGEKVGTK